MRAAVLGASLICAMASGLWAHGSEKHGPAAIAKPAPQADAGPVTPLPWQVGGPFRLTDHTGASRGQADPDGRMQLLFFGYANCPGICSAALPMMAHAAELLQARGIATRPVMITIDPTLDTLDSLGPALAKHSEDFVGLTGAPEDLNVAYDAFQISFEKIMDDPDYGPIYAHGSHIYLLDGAGEVLTLLPPILPPEQLAGIVARYAEAPNG